MALEFDLDEFVKSTNALIATPVNGNDIKFNFNTNTKVKILDSNSMRERERTGIDF